MKNNLLEIKSQLEACLVKINELIDDKNTTEEEDAPKVTLTEFENLKNLLQSSHWPVAVDPTLICDTTSEEDKLNRAEGILELLIEESVKDKKFLDLGCGEGQVAYKAISQEVSLSVGYDVKECDWTKYQNEKLIFTTNQEVVKQNSPFDVILIYDVLDHTSRENALELMNFAKSLLTENGKIYLRTHPFCSRHATHLYQKLNKAFVHLVFTDDEIHQLGYETDNNWKVIYPLKEYGELIRNSELKTQSHNILRQQIEPFFKRPNIAKRIISNYIGLNEFPEFQLEQQFLDYVLTK